MEIKFEKFFKLFIYTVVPIFIVTYILGKIFGCGYLLSFTNFDSNSGILWIIIISLIIAHIPTLKSIIREVASNRVAHLTDDEVVELFKERTEANEDFFKLIKKKLDELEAGSDTAPKIGNEVSSGSNILKDN
jgi:hypothetical protein